MCYTVKNLKNVAKRCLRYQQNGNSVILMPLCHLLINLRSNIGFQPSVIHLLKDSVMDREWDIKMNLLAKYRRNCLEPNYHCGRGYIYGKKPNEAAPF